MALLDLRKAGRDGEGRIAADMTYRDSDGHVTSREVALTPPSLRERVYVAVRDRAGWMSRAEIAKALGLKKTPYLNTVIEKLVSDGLIERGDGFAGNRALMFWYRLPDLIGVQQ